MYFLVPCVTGNSKPVKMPIPLNHTYSCSMCYRQDIQFIRYGPWVNHTPQKWEIGWISRKLMRSPHLTIYIHVPYVIGNVCNTLDMAPGVNPIPPKMRNCQISWNLLRSLPSNHIYSCSMCYRQDIQFIKYGPWGQLYPPEMGKC